MWKAKAVLGYSWAIPQLFSDYLPIFNTTISQSGVNVVTDSLVLFV